MVKIRRIGDTVDDSNTTFETPIHFGGKRLWIGTDVEASIESFGDMIFEVETAHKSSAFCIERVRTI